MKILIFGNVEKFKGREQSKIAQTIAKQGHKVYFVGNSISGLKSTDSFVYICLPYHEYRFDFLRIDDKIDVVLGLHQSVVPFVADYRIKTRAKSYCLFLDFPAHIIDGKDWANYDLTQSQVFYYWINCALELDGIIFTSAIASKEFYKRYKRQSFVLYYSAVSDNFIDRECSDYICGNNDLIAINGVDIGIESIKLTPYAYEHIYYNSDPIQFDIIKDIAKSIPNKIKLYFRPDDKIKIIQQSRLFLSCQHGQWLRNEYIIESLSAGVPAICFDYPVLRDLYQDSVIYVKPFDFKKMTKQIIGLYEDIDYNKELGIVGHNHFMQRFEINRVVTNLLDILRGINET